MPDADPFKIEAPLKKFVRCAPCGVPLIACKASKNHEFYYKCKTIGCRCNRRVADLHEVFRALLLTYGIKMDGRIRKMIEQQMIETYHKLTSDKSASKTAIQGQISA